MNKKRKQIVIIIVTIFCIFAFAAGSGIFLQKEKKPSVQYLNASWTYAYSGLEELTKESDLIAFVRITGLDRVKDGEVPSSYFKAEITEAVKDSDGEKEIVIYMTGIKNEEKWIEIQDDPLVCTGEEYLIFARKNTTGTYSILGGPQGRLLYENELLTAQTYLNQQKKTDGQAVAVAGANNSADFLQIHEKEASKMIAEIKAYMNE